VPTYHHQAVARLGEGLVAGAHAEDGTVEALELPDAAHPFVLAVQWHPEEGRDVRVMRALVEAARARGQSPGEPQHAPPEAPAPPGSPTVPTAPASG
jgi:putative glutamine amidotransferase